MSVQVRVLVSCQICVNIIFKKPGKTLFSPNNAMALTLNKYNLHI